MDAKDYSGSEENQKEYALYYSYQKVRDFISSFLRDREIRFASSKWWFVGLKVNNGLDLLNNFKRYQFFEYPTLIYHSLARLNMPLLSFENSEKRKQLAKFNSKFNRLVYDFDFCLDFDAKKEGLNIEDEKFSLELCKRELKEVADFFEKETDMPYRQKCSGSGLHFEILHPISSLRRIGLAKKLEFFNDFALALKDMLSLETLDLTIYDNRRIWKTPFSIDTKTFRVAVPINKNDIKSFDYSKCKIKKVLEILNIGRFDEWNEYITLEDSFNVFKNNSYDFVDKKEHLKFKQDLFDVWKCLFNVDYNKSKRIMKKRGF